MPTLEEKVNEMYEEFMVPRKEARQTLKEFDYAIDMYAEKINCIIVNAKKRRELVAALQNFNMEVIFIDIGNERQLSYQNIPVFKDNNLNENEIIIK